MSSRDSSMSSLSSDSSTSSTPSSTQKRNHRDPDGPCPEQPTARRPSASLPLPLHPPRTLLGTPFDPSPRFEYPFPSPTPSPDTEHPPFPSPAVAAVLPPLAALSKLSLSLSPFRFVRPPPVSTPSADSSASASSTSSYMSTSTSASTTNQSARTSPVLVPALQNPKAAAAASARDAPIPPSLKRRRHSHILTKSSETSVRS